MNSSWTARELAKFKHLGGGELRAQPGPNKKRPLRKRKQSTRLNCAASPSYSGPDIVRFGTSLYSATGYDSSLFSGGRAPRSPRPSLMLTSILVWGHPPCGHCHAGARQWSSVWLVCVGGW